jgi:hypothetical protein
METSSLERETLLRCGRVKVAVVTYSPGYIITQWSTMLVVLEEENPTIWNAADTKDEALRCHDEAVRLMKMLGAEEVNNGVR